MKGTLLKYKNKVLVLCFDTLMIPTAWFLAYWLRFNLSHIPSNVYYIAIEACPLIIAVQTLCYFFYRQYRGIWHFSSVPDLFRILKSVLTATLIMFALTYPYHTTWRIPRSIYPLYTMLLISLLSAGRLLWRSKIEHNKIKNSDQEKKRALIIGAGEAGETLARDLKRDANSPYKPVAFLDDSPQRTRTEIHGIPVVGTTTDVVEACQKYKIDLINIAIPSASSAQIRQIVEQISKTKLPFQTLPNLSALASGRVSIQDLREVSLEDLLGREPVSLDRQSIHHTLDKKRILVTGGGGSIGAELCRQLLQFDIDSLLILDHSEYNLYAIEHELRSAYPNKEIQIALISITDEIALKATFKHFKPQVVFHAAAYKHVPMLESQVRCAVKNNFLGTRLVADTAVDHQVEKFVLVSTDKAVNPTNIMGATKRAAEIYCQNLNERVDTQFITVRFGNVLGSAGSVVPLFKKQLETGGPITVTHPDITRFFMLIPEACQLILQASTLGNGGEIFVLDMGKPIKIIFLAEQLIRLSGKEVDKDIKIKFTGLRPGEKLFEELFHEKEALGSTKHSKIFVANKRSFEWTLLNKLIDKIVHNVNMYNDDLLSKEILSIVPEYKFNNIRAPGKVTTV